MNWKKLLKVIESESKCKRAKIGAIIYKESRIISTGWNGMPSGFDNCCENEAGTKGEVIHAEANSILFAAKIGIALKGATLVCSQSPCIECAKMILQSGITKVEYVDEYRDLSGLKLLQTKITCVKV